MTNFNDYVNGLAKNTDEIREGREKGDNIFDKVITINNFLICSGDNGTYSEYTVAEDNEHFFFGGSVLTNLLTKKKSEKGREYVAVEIITSDLPF